MFTPSNQSDSLGLYKTSRAVQLAKISYNKNKYTVDQLLEIPSSEKDREADSINALYLPDGTALTSLVDEVCSATALSTAEVLVRPLEIALTKDRDLEAVFHFQAEPLLPYPLEEAVINKVKLRRLEESTLLTLFAVRKTRLMHHIQHWKAWEIEPELVFCVPVALATLTKYCTTAEQPCIVLHLGEDHSSCVLVDGGVVVASYSLSDGIYLMEKALSEDLKLENDEAQKVLQSLDFTSINTSEMPQLSQFIQQMKLGIARVVYALSKQSKECEVSQILVTGCGATLINFKEVLTKDLPKGVAIAESDILGVSTSDLNRYAVAIGLALAVQENGREGMDFRREDFAYPHPWKRIKKPLLTLLSLGLVCALCMYFFGQMWMGYQEDQLREKYGELLVSQYKSMEEFEAEYRKKHGLGAMHEGEKVHVKELSREEIAQRLEYLQHSLESTPEIFPLQPNTPRVSDVLGWLSAHPNVASGNDEGSSALLHIENLTYNMVKRPEQSKKNEKYQVKVELDFSSPTPKLAREFHDALIAPNDFVDPKGEVKWSANRGKYHTSFFLKDRTIYPSQGGS
jgi:type IV pilus assembly protein PilM